MKRPIALCLSAISLSIAGVAAGESSIPVRLSIPAGVEVIEKGRTRIVTGLPNADGGEIAAKWVAGRKSTASSERKEVIVPTDYAWPELREGTALESRADGSLVLVGDKISGDPEEFPVTPANPIRFEVIETGWELTGTVKRIQGGLIEFRGTVRHTGVTLQRGVFGEKTGPIVTEMKGLFGKAKDVMLTENRALMGAKSVTETPLIIRAKPGAVYAIEVTAFGKTIPARISLGAGEKSGTNKILQAGVAAR